MTVTQMESMRRLAEADARRGTWQVIDRRGRCVSFDLAEERARRDASYLTGATVRNVPRLEVA